MKLVFLGTSGADGVPAFYCNCEACREARRNSRFSRTRSAILLKGEKNTLIDVPPDIRVQLIREHISDVERIFLTHWHYDHCAGFGDIGFYVYVKRKKPIDLYLHEKTMQSFQASFGYMGSSFNLNQLKAYQPCHFKDFTITPIEVVHSVSGFGFLIESNIKIAYLPDTYFASKRTKEFIRNVDVLIVDAAFFGKSIFKERRHMSVDEAIQFRKEVNAKITYLTHLSMHYSKPVTSKKLEQYVKKYRNVKIAYDGLQIDI